MNQTVVVGDPVRSQYLDRTNVSEIFVIFRSLESIRADNAADREQPVVRHVRDHDKVIDLHVILFFFLADPLPPVAHPPVPFSLPLVFR